MKIKSSTVYFKNYLSHILHTSQFNFINIHNIISLFFKLINANSAYISSIRDYIHIIVNLIK